ncbi:MAG TPA: hypothetical protein VGS12_10680 [Caulobacteraceae bacterium]|nr:hypothetical protein [Caulobacteraceae bacterium]
MLPKHFDGGFRGARAAAWLLGVAAFVRLMIGLASIFNARQAASGPDGIPLDRYPPGAAQTILSLFQLLGLYETLPALFAMVALIRYRALIPLAYLLLLIGQLGSRALLLANPAERSSPPDVATLINLGLLALMLVGLPMSLIGRKQASSAPLPGPAALE